MTNTMTSANCESIQRVIYELDEVGPDEMSLERRQQITSHLAICESCRQLREHERQLTDMLLAGNVGGSSPPSVVTTVAPSKQTRPRRVNWKLMGVAGALAASLFLLASFVTVSRQFSQVGKTRGPLQTANFGSICTRPVISDALWLSTNEYLESENHIQLPVGAVSTIDLTDTGKLTASGPATFEIDRVDGTWKVTLLSGRVKVDVAAHRFIKVANASGASELAHGTFWVSDSFPFLQQEEGDQQKSVDELMDEAMKVFSPAGNTGPDAMKHCADLLKQALDHPDMDDARRLSARFYRAAALANSGQHAAAIEAAESCMKDYPGIPGEEVLLALLGDSYWATDKKEEAKKAWKKLLEQNPDSPYRPGIVAKLGEDDGEKMPKAKVVKEERVEAKEKAEAKEGAGAGAGAGKEVGDGLSLLWKKGLKSPSFGSATIADADGDGKLEIAFGTYFNDDSVYVLNAEDGSERWSKNFGTACLDASMRFFDLDSDGDLELLVPISNQGKMISFDADSGKEIWSYQPDPIECTDSPSCIMDIDGDGKIEFVYGTFHGNLHVVDGTSGKEKRIYKISDEFIQTGPTAIDLNGDGKQDFVCGVMKGSNNIYATDGDTGERLWEFKIPGEHMGVYHGCSVGDLDGDEKMELVISAYDGKVYCLEAASGKQRWVADPPDSYFMSPVVIADLDNDGQMRVISAGSHVSVIDHEGNILWSKPCAVGGYDTAARGASLADLNGDFTLDIVTLSGAGTFQVLNSAGETMHRLDASKIAGFPVNGSSHGPVIADMNGDGKLDVFFAVGSYQRDSSQGMAMCLTGFPGSGRGWYMLRHDPRNTGNYQTEIDPSLLRHIER